MEQALTLLGKKVVEQCGIEKYIYGENLLRVVIIRHVEVVFLLTKLPNGSNIPNKW